jgi:fumarate hydratase, class II
MSSTTIQLQHNDDVAASLTARTESDAMGSLQVPAGCLWGAQTQRSLENFPIGGPESRMPLAVVQAMALVKKCCALYHAREDVGQMKPEIAQAIAQAADEVLAGKLDRHFPLVTFQTGRYVAVFNIVLVVKNTVTNLINWCVFS